MGQFKHSAVALRIFGDDLEPDEVTRLVGCEPTVAQRTGEVIRYSSGRTRTVKCGNWRLQANSAEPEDIDGQIRHILSLTTDDLGIWKSLSDRFDVDMFCGVFMESSNDGFSLSVDVLQMLGHRGIEVGFDVYDAGEDETSVANARSDSDAQS